MEVHRGEVAFADQGRAEVGAEIRLQGVQNAFAELIRDLLPVDIGAEVRHEDHRGHRAVSFRHEALLHLAGEVQVHQQLIRQTVLREELALPGPGVPRHENIDRVEVPQLHRRGLERHVVDEDRAAGTAGQCLVHGGVMHAVGVDQKTAAVGGVRVADDVIRLADAVIRQAHAGHDAVVNLNRLDFGVILNFAVAFQEELHQPVDVGVRPAFHVIDAPARHGGGDHAVEVGRSRGRASAEERPEGVRRPQLRG